MAPCTRSLRIGVDVGGTNTDGVILDPSRSSESGRGIIAWHKTPTTKDPSTGIQNAITTMFEEAKIDPDDVASVTIGTTHFVNAVIEMDMSRLSRVAVIRLCSGFGKHALPGIDWPEHMKTLCGHVSLVKGGLEVDGDLISDIDEEEIRQQCKVIQDKKLTSIVIAGVFSPIDTIHRQEEHAAAIVREVLPECDVVLSKDVANIGFLERENAAILNAAILRFARKTVKAFQEPMKQLKLRCPLFITQNDGTVLTAEAAAKLPIRTFSSGPTNSMRGASFLVQKEDKEAMMIVDIGGTTTDVGLLLSSGFPRQAAAFSELSGVRMNFSYPDVKSIGLGGGSLVRYTNGNTTVGPDSVGYELPQKALVFGGEIPTATDYTVANGSVTIGDPSLVQNFFDHEKLHGFTERVKTMLERVIETMKTSPEDIPVILVGGGAIIAPDTLKGASKVVKPEWSGVANAIGAATARMSETVDTVRSTEKKSTKEILKEISEEVVEKLVQAGAKRSTAQIVEIDNFPLQYIANKTRFVVRAAGDFDFVHTAELNTLDHATETATESQSIESPQPETTTASVKRGELEQAREETKPLDVLKYTPVVKDRVWHVSEVDVEWISTGCYILGTGGGGSPYSHMLRLRGILRDGGVVRIISPTDLKDDDLVGGGGGAGSPSVSIEKLQSDEMLEAQRELYGLLGTKAHSMIALEIGGGNGLQGMILGGLMNILTVDGDWMGRAYPTLWQITPVVFEDKVATLLPVTCVDGNGVVMTITKSRNELTSERIIRASLAQMGSHVACAFGPVTGKNTKKWVVENTISLSWRLGRCVALARQNNCVDRVAEEIVEELGGIEAAKVLFKGKIVGVERTLRMGHIYGEVIIESAHVGDAAAGNKGDFDGVIKIPFKNENIAALKMEDDGSESLLAIVPDLIAVIDAQNGEAIGTPEYRFGLLVIVLGITASEKWTSTPRALEIGGPKAFGMDEMEYRPLGKFKAPLSVIDEYSFKAS